MAKYDVDDLINKKLEAIREGDPEAKRVNLLYLGMRYDDYEGKLQYRFVDVTQIENGGDSLPNSVGGRLYSGRRGKNFVQGMPGTIYAFVESADSLYTGTAVYMGQWRNGDDCAAWRAADRAQRLAKDQHTRNKKAMKRDLALERLQPFREAYRRTRAADRPFLLAWIIREITK